MISGFYAMIFAFIFTEIYHVFNRNRLDLIFKKKEVESIKKIDILFYLSKLLSILWPLIGLFSSFSGLFMMIMVINLLKFVFYHASDSTYRFYIKVLPFMNIVAYITILMLKFKR